MARGQEMAVYCPVGELYVVMRSGYGGCPHCGQYQHYLTSTLDTSK